MSISILFDSITVASCMVSSVHIIEGNAIASKFDNFLFKMI